jgi:hypothetical protein
MKKSIFTHFAMAIFFCIAGLTAQAQLQIGGGLVYHTEIQELGINVRAQLDVGELGNATLGVVPHGTYYLIGDGLSWIELGADANLRFGDVDAIVFYPIVGLRYDLVTVSFFGVSASSGEFGFNAGAGTQINLGGLTVFVEAKFQPYFSEFEGTPIGIQGGVLVPLGN